MARGIVGAVLGGMVAATPLLAVSGVAHAGGSHGKPVALTVTSGANAGPGSLRDALATASADPKVGAIVLAVPTVGLSETVSFTGSQALTIDGRGSTVTQAGGSAPIDLVRSAGGGALTLQRLTLAGAGGVGLLVEVPATQATDQVVNLDRVTIRDNALNGVYVDDCLGVDLPAQCPESASGSPAGVVLTLSAATIKHNGIGALADFDGIRVDERGTGSVAAMVVQSAVTLNDADGIELDESGVGDVSLRASRSAFDDNGAQPQALIDPEDGFDIDEADDGHVTTELTLVSAQRNFDENLDFNETGAGDLLNTLDRAVIDGAKAGRGYDLEEGGAGNLAATVSNSAISRSLEDGMRAQERSSGRLDVTVVRTTFVSNGDAGLEVDQQGTSPDAGTAAVSYAWFSGNVVGIQVEGNVVVTTTKVIGA